MLSYNDIYEILRKEKYSESLQVLPKTFLLEFSDYLKEKKEQSSKDDGLFEDSVAKTKKQYENSLAIFKELILRRKKKLLNLVFIAAETGIMKRDYENMLNFEKDIFDKLVKIFEEGDKSLAKELSGKKHIDLDSNKMIIFLENVDQFIDMEGKAIGPYNKGELANLDKSITELFVSTGKAKYVDEN